MNTMNSDIQYYSFYILFITDYIVGKNTYLDAAQIFLNDSFKDSLELFMIWSTQNTLVMLHVFVFSQQTNQYMFFAIIIWQYTVWQIFISNLIRTANSQITAQVK